MSAVYEAEHLATEARVALKVLSPRIGRAATARRRFDLEARVAARVNSENIVSVLDAGIDPDTRAPYLAMELLSGETLAAHIERRGRLDPGSATEVLRQVARGLDAAHGYRTAAGVRKPIVHRDLKPDNLFLTHRADGALLVKILDFGLAKVSSESAAISRDMRGTPLYMAFEQVAGKAVSPQTDVWALGLLAYFVLTGRHYWVASGGREPGHVEALFAEILARPLVRPSERWLEQGLELSLPSAFDAWMLTCIDRAPAKRHASASAAVDAFEALFSLAIEPVAPSQAGSLRRESLATARYASVQDLPPAIVRARPAFEAAAVPAPRALEPGEARAMWPRLRRSSWMQWGAAFALAGLPGVAIVWSIAHWTARRVPSEPPVVASSELAPERPASAKPLEPPPLVTPAPPASTPRASGPRVTVVALESTSTLTLRPVPAPTRSRRSSAARNDSRASRSATPSMSTAPGAATEETASACDVFNPYNGRCVIQTTSSPSKR